MPAEAEVVSASEEVSATPAVVSAEVDVVLAEVGLPVDAVASLVTAVDDVVASLADVVASDDVVSSSPDVSSKDAAAFRNAFRDEAAVELPVGLVASVDIVAAGGALLSVSASEAAVAGPVDELEVVATVGVVDVDPVEGVAVLRVVGLKAASVGGGAESKKDSCVEEVCLLLSLPSSVSVVVGDAVEDVSNRLCMYCWKKFKEMLEEDDTGAAST